MLNNFEVTFCYRDFEDKLCHYFKDTSPIYANVTVFPDKVQIAYVSPFLGSIRSTITVPIAVHLSVKENVFNIILKCEQLLYPKMVEFISKEQNSIYCENDILTMLMQGLSFEQIHKKKKFYKDYFTIIRFNIRNNTIDFRKDSSGDIFRARLGRPLIITRDRILELFEKGVIGMSELFHFIMGNSLVDKLEKKLLRLDNA